ncbi:hypothetical protein [Acuticoccus kandeliae]|uniref:hypothetical protein n=1 Tax=Acuticoccus kandeliae TaxID=2073160 RepID=UPI000D3E2EE8|nr:hypothetical protein [Acuticoccus kandeliae]
MSGPLSLALAGFLHLGTVGGATPAEAPPPGPAEICLTVDEMGSEACLTVRAEESGYEACVHDRDTGIESCLFVPRETTAPPEQELRLEPAPEWIMPTQI